MLAHGYGFKSLFIEHPGCSGRMAKAKQKLPAMRAWLNGTWGGGTTGMLVVLMAVWAAPLKAQPPSAPSEADSSRQGYWGWAAAADYGFIIVHSRDVRAVEDSYPWGVTAETFWQWTRMETYRNCRCYPKVGLAFKAWNYDNPRLLGNGYVLNTFLEPVYGAHRRLSFAVRGGAGVTYGTQPFDSLENPNNLSYSTDLSFYLLLGTRLHYRLHPQWKLSLSAYYNHVSNGGVRKPNKGINFPTASLGVAHYLENARFPQRELPAFKPGKARRWGEVYLFGSRRRISSTGDRSYAVAGVSGRYQWQVGRSNALGLGAEYSFDDALPVQSQAQELARHPGHQLGVMGGHNFLMGRFYFSQYIGLYLYNPVAVHPRLFQRYALVYAPARRWRAGIALKAHAEVASFLDVRLGYAF